MDTTTTNTTRFDTIKTYGGILILGIILLRFTTLHILPLIDPSEGRYATIAQVMNQTGDLITPRLINHEGQTVPFLGKPPLLFWMVSFWDSQLHNEELGARLPSFFAFLATLALSALFMLRAFNRRSAIDATLMLASCTIFFIFAGICQMDMLLTATHALALCSFYFFIESRKQLSAETAKRLFNNSSFWMFSFFIALGLGMLVKGPIAIVLTGLTVALWTTWTKQWRLLLQTSLSWPIALGIAAFFSIWTPWYLLAEKHNPGFLQYFLVNENFLRYITTSYGDRYGSSHKVPHGTSWIYLLLGAMPWSLYLLRLKCWGKESVVKQLSSHISDADKFIICWFIAPAIFFTFARSILISYLVPAIPAFAMLLTRIFTSKISIEIVGSKKIRQTSLVIAITALAVSFASFAYGLQYSLIHLATKPDSSLMLSVLFWGCSCFVLMRLFSKPHSTGIHSLAFISVLTVCSLTYSLRYFIGDNFSTSTIFNIANKSDLTAIQHFNFPEGIPYTANIYSILPLESDLEEINNPEEDEQEIMIFRRPKKTTENLLTHNALPTFMTGIWEAFNQEAISTRHNQ